MPQPFKENVEFFPNNFKRQKWLILLELKNLLTWCVPKVLLCGKFSLDILDFATSSFKVSIYMQYDMMLLEHCRRKLAEQLITITWLHECQFHVCFVKWLNYKFLITYISLHYFFKFVNFWSSGSSFLPDFELAERRNIYYIEVLTKRMFKYNFLLYKHEILFYTTKVLDYKKFAQNCVEEWKFGRQWAPKHFASRCKSSLLWRKNKKCKLVRHLIDRVLEAWMIIAAQKFN